MGAHSRNKGIRGEWEVRDLLRKHGFEAERGQQRAGGGDSPDVKTSAPIFVEVKRVKSLKTLYRWYAKAQEDGAEAPGPPVLFIRADQEGPGTPAPRWLVVLDAEDYLDQLYDAVFWSGS